MDQNIHWLSGVAACLRLLSIGADQWRLGLILALFVAPQAPHLRWSYQYSGSSAHPYYLSCSYLGPRGFIRPDFAPDCPFLVFIDARDWPR